MKHLDLFSGIGGFALAADRVFENVEHTFCEIDPFCQEILKKHWPKSKIHGDIRTLTNTSNSGRRDTKTIKDENREKRSAENRKLARGSERPFILTGGFPCQPFSQAGQRKGTADDRHLWPEMLRVIREFAPLWVIGENVGGFITWNDGMVLRQVFSDLEGEGYEVQAFIIPAVSVNAPHRRDRVWIIANRISSTSRREYGYIQDKRRSSSKNWATSIQSQDRKTQSDNFKSSNNNASDTKRSRYERQEHKERPSTRHDRQIANVKDSISKRGSGGDENSRQVLGIEKSEVKNERPSWEENWIEVATRLCRVDDGLPKRLDRNPRLKALGNAIVPQVAEEIFKAIKLTIE